MPSLFLGHHTPEFDVEQPISLLGLSSNSRLVRILVFQVGPAEQSSEAGSGQQGVGNGDLSQQEQQPPSAYDWPSLRVLML